jgi:hypothetical protein
MSQDYKVDFATFCYVGDSHRLHQPGQLKRQVESNSYSFNQAIIIYQRASFAMLDKLDCHVQSYKIIDIDLVLATNGIDLSKPQYTSTTDKAHTWKNHVVNHLAALNVSRADYIVFADNDCWMVNQPQGKSWIERGIQMLENDPDCFIVSPNDGEPERRTLRMSQQMFLVNRIKFKYADLNQPEWDGNVNIPGGPMPEYWAMLEGRMELHCRAVGMHRHVLGPEYRYWHFNRLTKDDLFEIDVSKY